MPEVNLKDLIAQLESWGIEIKISIERKGENAGLPLSNIPIVNPYEKKKKSKGGPDIRRQMSIEKITAAMKKGNIAVGKIAFDAKVSYSCTAKVLKDMKSRGLVEESKDKEFTLTKG